MPAAPFAPSQAAVATTACSTLLGGVDLPAVGFAIGDVVLGDLLKERGLVPVPAASIDVIRRRRHRGGSAVRAARRA